MKWIDFALNALLWYLAVMIVGLLIFMDITIIYRLITDGDLLSWVLMLTVFPILNFIAILVIYLGLTIND